jgi:hypothetical protein
MRIRILRQFNFVYVICFYVCIFICILFVNLGRFICRVDTKYRKKLLHGVVIRIPHGGRVGVRACPFPE